MSHNNRPASATNHRTSSTSLLSSRRTTPFQQRDSSHQPHPPSSSSSTALPPPPSSSYSRYAKSDENDYTLLSTSSPSATTLHAASGRQRAIMQQADEMRTARLQAYKQIQSNIRQLEQGLQQVETNLKGDFDSSGETDKDQRLVRVDQILSRRDAIREILGATTAIASRRPPGLESSSSSASDDDTNIHPKESEKESNNKGEAEQGTERNQNHQKPGDGGPPIVHFNVQRTAADGVDVQLISSAVRAVNKAEGKSDDRHHIIGRKGEPTNNNNNNNRGSVSFSSRAGVAGDKNNLHNHQNLSGTIGRTAKAIDEINLSSIRNETSYAVLPKGIDLEEEAQDDDDDSAENDEDNGNKIIKKKFTFGDDDAHQSDDDAEDNEGKDVDGRTSEEVEMRFTQPVQDALDFFSVSCERTEHDVRDKILDPPLRIETAQGKFFTIGRQYADIASRMIQAIDVCRMISEKSLKLVQPLLSKGNNQSVASIAAMVANSSPAAAATLSAVGMNTSHLVLNRNNTNDNNNNKNKRSSSANDIPTDANTASSKSSSSPSKKNSSSSSGATSFIDPQFALELSRQLEAERERFMNFRHLAKQLTSVIGGLNRCNLDARDLLDDLSQRDTLMAAERSKMNVAKEEATNVTAMRDELKSELWLHRASNKMRMAIRRKAERIREKKAAQALLLGNLDTDAPSELQQQKDKERLEREKHEELEKLARNPVPPGVGAPAMASVGTSRVVGPMTIVHVALDRYPEMWSAAPAAATKTLQMYREAIHASLWYASRLAIDAARLKAYQVAREEMIKKYKDANEPFTEEEEKTVKPKPLAPSVEIFAEQIQYLVHATAPLLNATAGISHQQEKALSPLEWSKRFSGRRVSTAASSLMMSSSLSPTSSNNAAAAGYSPAAFAAQARKRGESPYQPQKTPGVFSHESFPYRSLLGLPGDKVLEQLNNGAVILNRNNNNNNNTNSNNLGSASSSSTKNSSYMNLGPPPVTLLAEGDGALPGSGDGGYVLVAFADPTVAVKWMCGLQVLLSQLPWPTGVMNAEIYSDRSENGREKVFPQLNRFDNAVRERLAAAEQQANNNNGGGASSPKLSSSSVGGGVAMEQLEEDAAFIAFSRRFGLQQEEGGGPGSKEFDTEPWKQIAILLSRQWGCGDQRFPGALFRGPLVRMGAHVGSVPFDEIRQIEASKLAPYYLDPYRKCATIPQGTTPAVASWLCHQARGGEILISDALAEEVKETVKREAIFNRRVPLPASARDFFVNTNPPTADVAKLEVIEPTKPSDKKSSRASMRRRSSLGRRSSIDSSASISVSVHSKTSIEQVQKKEVYLSASTHPSQAQDTDCAVQLFPPVLLERALILGAPSSSTAKNSHYVARVVCYNPNWWVWINTTPVPFIPRQKDLELLSSRRHQIGSGSNNNRTLRRQGSSSVMTMMMPGSTPSSATATAATAATAGGVAGYNNPLLEAVGWTHAETIQMQRQELYRCAHLIEKSQRKAATALRQQRQATEISAMQEGRMMMMEDRSAFADALGILRTANAESFVNFSSFIQKWDDAMKNEIATPAMPILPQQTTMMGGGRTASFSGSFRFSSFSSSSHQQPNDFASSNVVSAFTLSNVVLQAVIHRIKVLKEEREHNKRIERENMRTYDPSQQQQPKIDRSSFAKWFKKAEQEQLSAQNGFSFQLLIRVVDGLYEECFNTICAELDSASSKLSLAIVNNNNDKKNASPSSVSTELLDNNINTFSSNITTTSSSSTSDTSSSINHHQYQQSSLSLLLRPDQLHRRFCNELMRCVNHLDAIFNVPVLLLPSRAVCIFAATRPHNHILNPPSILDWNAFANNFVHVNWQKFIHEYYQICFPTAATTTATGNSSSSSATCDYDRTRKIASSSILLSDLIGLHAGSTPRWCLSPAVWCGRRMSGTGSGGGAHVASYKELMNAIREPTMGIWVNQAQLLRPVICRATTVTASTTTVTANKSSSSTSTAATSLASTWNNNNNSTNNQNNNSIPTTTQNPHHDDQKTKEQIESNLFKAIPDLFENSEFDLSEFDFPTYLLTKMKMTMMMKNTNKNNASRNNTAVVTMTNIDNDKSFMMRWWPSVRYGRSSSSPAKLAHHTQKRNVNTVNNITNTSSNTNHYYSVLEIRHSALSQRYTLARIASTLEFIKRKSQVPDVFDSYAAVSSSSASSSPSAATTKATIYNNNNSSSHTPGLSWSHLFQPVLGVGATLDPSKEFGVARIAIIQPHNHTLHDRLLRDYSNPTNSIFENEALTARRKREMLRIAIALRQLHEYGLFHGNIRPDNIFVEEESSSSRSGGTGNGTMSGSGGGGTEYFSGGASSSLHASSSSSRVCYRLGNMVLVPELVMAALTSERPLKRKVLSGGYSSSSRNSNNSKKKSDGSIEQDDSSSSKNKINQGVEPNDDADDDEDEDAKWGYVAPELLRYLSHGGSATESSPSEMDRDTLSPQSLAKSDMFSFGVLMLTVFSGGYDHTFTQLLDRVDLEQEKEQIEREYQKKAEEAALAAYRQTQQQQQQQQQEEREQQGKKNAQNSKNNSTDAHQSHDDSDSNSNQDIGEGTNNVQEKQQQQQSLTDEFNPNIMTAAQLKQIADEKAIVLEKRLLSATAASAYQIVSRAAESLEGLVMLGSLKWLRYSIFAHLERERSEPTNSEALAQKRREAKEDDDILERKQTHGFSGAQSFAFAIKRLVSRGRRGGAFKIKKEENEADQAISGLLLIDLVSQLIVLDPSKRMTAAEVCDHPFFADVMISSSTSLPIPSTTCSVDLSSNIVPPQTNSNNNNGASLSSANCDNKNRQQKEKQQQQSTAPGINNNNNNNNNTTSIVGNAAAAPSSSSSFAAPNANVNAVVATLTPTWDSNDHDGEGAAQLRGFLRSAEQALLRIRNARDLEKGRNRHGSGSNDQHHHHHHRRPTTTSSSSSSSIRWTISLDDSLTQLSSKNYHVPRSRKYNNSNNNNRRKQNDDDDDDDDNENEREVEEQEQQQQESLLRKQTVVMSDDEDDEFMTSDTDSSSCCSDGSENNDASFSSQRQTTGGNYQKKKHRHHRREPRPLHFDVRIAPSSSETMWRAWRYQRKMATSLLETKMEALLRRAYDLREFVQQSTF